MIYKRGRVYWYKFTYGGQAIRESTKQGNDRMARSMEAAHKTSLARGEAGFRERKVIPTLRNFCTERFEPWAKATFENTCRNNWFWFRAGIRCLTAYEPLAKAKLDEITTEKVAGFVAHEQTRLQNRGRDDGEQKRGMSVSSINSSLRVLRRILHVSTDWGLLEAAPKIQKLPGERRRERVISHDEEARYLAAAPEPLQAIATLLADSGLRPSECYALRWENIHFENGRNGTLLVERGKTAAARRQLPLTPRVRAVLKPAIKTRASRKATGFFPRPPVAAMPTTGR